MKVKVIRTVDKSRFEDELEMLYNDPNIEVIQLDTHTESGITTQSIVVHYIAIVVYYKKDNVILPTIKEEN